MTGSEKTLQRLQTVFRDSSFSLHYTPRASQVQHFAVFNRRSLPHRLLSDAHESKQQTNPEHRPSRSSRFPLVGTIDIISIGSAAFLASVQRGMTFTPLSDLMETQVVNPPRPYSPYERLNDEAALHENVIDYKRLHIDVDRSRVAVSYDVYLRKDHPLFYRAERDWNPEGAVGMFRSSLKSSGNTGRNRFLQTVLLCL